MTGGEALKALEAKQKIKRKVWLGETYMMRFQLHNEQYDEFRIFADEIVLIVDGKENSECLSRMFYHLMEDDWEIYE